MNSHILSRDHHLLVTVWFISLGFDYGLWNAVPLFNFFLKMSDIGGDMLSYALISNIPKMLTRLVSIQPHGLSLWNQLGTLPKAEASYGREIEAHDSFMGTSLVDITTPNMPMAWICKTSGIWGIVFLLLCPFIVPIIRNVHQLADINLICTCI